MTNEHISRLEAIGLGKEVTSGTAVAASVWIPKKSGQITPSFEKAVDDSAYGVIDEVYDSQTVKNMTEVTVEGIARDDWLGYLLLGAMGQSTEVAAVTLAGVSGGTPARGDSVYVGSPGSETWIGEIKKITVVGSNTYYWCSTTSGTLNDTDTMTDGTWSGTATVSTYAAAYGHFFERLNTNAHPSFTMYASDDVGDERAAYCMVDTFELSVAVGEFAKFNVNMKGKQLSSTSSQTPSYSADNPFLAKHAEVYFGDAESDLNGASASSVQSFKLTINKNLTDVMEFGDTDISTLHNQQFTINGDLEAIYNATTFRDYVANSTKKACRLEFINNAVTALYSDGAQSIYPSLIIDMARLSFEEWSKSEDNNNLVTQSMGFSGEYKAADTMTLEILLINDNSSGY